MALQAHINSPTPRSMSEQGDKSQDGGTELQQVQLQENQVEPLSDRDRDIFLAWMELETRPNEALVEAARRFKQEGL